MSPSPIPSEDPLETRLRQTTAPLADNGFSARVLASLPPPTPKPRSLPSRRFVVCSLGALTGLLWAIAQPGSPRVNDLPAIGNQLVNSAASITHSLANPAVLAVGSVILVSLAFAFFHEIAGKFD